MIEDDLHERLRKAEDAYYAVAKDMHPQMNVAYLPEHIEMQRVMLEHHNKCDCRWSYGRNMNIFGFFNE